MKCSSLKLSSFLVASLLVIFLPAVGVADWETNGSHKMHWPQLPDLSMTGMDVNATLPGWHLADDFMCMESGPITNIHIWGSWSADQQDTNALFMLSIHLDVPSPPAPYSHPLDPPLWVGYFDPMQYTVRVWAQDIQEGWFEPPDWYDEPGSEFADTICFQYNFPIPEGDEFIQEEGTIYWLNVQCMTTNWFGWKTTTTNLHWMDDACWTDDDLVPWTDLHYPTGHPYEGLTLDLAFVIDGGEEEALDFGDAPDTPYPTLLAIDGARHLVSGSQPLCLGATVDTEPDGQPDPNALGDDTAGIPDDEDGVAFTSALIPGNLAGVTVVASGVGLLDAWLDFNDDGDWSDFGEQIFANKVLGAGANALSFVVPYWATKSSQTFARFRLSTAGGLSVTGLAADGEVEDHEVTIEEGRVREPKWIKMPDLEDGFDVVSSLDETDTLVADDFVSDGRPIAGLRWWGSYTVHETGTDGPVPPPTGVDHPPAFVLTWYDDVAAGVVTNYSMPGNTLLSDKYSLCSWGVADGMICESYYGTITNSAGSYEHEYVYDLVLTNIWNEKQGVVYWLSVQADYAMSQPATYPWGWATTHPDNNFNDDAARKIFVFPGWEELTYDLLKGPTHPHGSNSVNLAFVLYTDVSRRRAKKWRQPPDMVTGENMASFWKLSEPLDGYPLRADDFVSDGRRITDIHWWGSYLKYRWTSEGPERPPTGTDAPISFKLSWHADIPDPDGSGPEYSMPSNPPLKEIIVPMDKCHEVYYGTVDQGWKEPLESEHEYQYYVDLMDPEIGDGDAWYEQSNIVYWLNVQAVFTNTWEPGAEHFGWGWKTTDPTNQWNDVSVVATNFPGGFPRWEEGSYPPIHPHVETNMDLAFELTTDEVGTNKWYGTIEFEEVDNPNAVNYLMWSVGDVGSGTQYLQSNTNLTTNVWADVASNPLPYPSPFSNKWKRTSLSFSNEFFRIEQR